MGREPAVEETEGTYVGNAVQKAEAVATLTGAPALGDDSGLEVEALGGFPGLRSARLAGTQEERHRILFERLTGVPRPWRARFVCSVALAVPGQPTRSFTGECGGELVEPRSGGRGFGYDPVFFVPEVGRTFDEMEPDEKDRWSHRAAALLALLDSGALAAVR